MTWAISPPLLHNVSLTISTDLSHPVSGCLNSLHFLTP